jgi:hypothetical protein
MFKLKPLAGSVALSLLTGVALAAAPGGAILQNQVTVTYTDIGGKAYTAQSNIVEISIREVRGATLTITAGENQEVAAAPGTKVYSVHTLTNGGNVTETYALTAANVTGGGDTLDASALKIYLDSNGNGVLDSGETTPITSTNLAAGGAVKLIVESTLPATIAASDTLKVTLDATDSKGTTASSTNTVNITFKDTNVTAPIYTWDQVSGGNCHAYTFIEPGAAITWTDAKTNAGTFVYHGKTGHLTTPTDAAENTFIAGKIPSTSGGVAWIGLHNPDGAWVTGETSSYRNWAPNNTGTSAIEPGTAITRGTGAEWSGSIGQWHDGLGTLADNRRMYAVEFDVDCPLPNVSIALEGAKDVTCDGTPDGAFGTARLAEMGSGECAILRSRATNNGQSLAKSIVLGYTVPTYASYVPGTLSIAGTAKTDAADTDEGAYATATKKLTANVGDVAVGATSPDAQFSVKID